MNSPPMHRRTPVVVIVDSRNVFGSVRRAFGCGRQVRVPGVRQALEAYGFDVHTVYVAIGTECPSSRQSQHLANSLRRNQDYASKIEAEPGGAVLHGRLVERAGQMEEKLVDVLCAIQIARSAHEIANGSSPARAIVVFSEDMDLIPAYEFAAQVGVPVFAASTATVDSRPDHSWLLLGEGVLRQACGRPYGRYAGHELRRQMVAALQRPSPVTMNFTVGGWSPKAGCLYLSHNSGARAVWHNPPPQTDKRSQATHTLSVTGVSMDGDRRDFPVYEVAPHPPATPGALPGLVEGEVTRWRTPTRAEVQLQSGETTSIEIPMGSALPGDKVLIHESGVGRQRAWRYVGAIAAPPPTLGWSDPTVPALACVTTSASTHGARVRALLTTDQEVTMQPPGADKPQAGDWYATLPIEHLPAASGTHVLTVAVSSRLG